MSVWTKGYVHQHVSFQPRWHSPRHSVGNQAQRKRYRAASYAPLVTSARARLALALTLLALTAWSAGLRTAAQPPARASAMPFDPAYVAAPPALACLPYATGAIQHAVHVGPDRIALTRTLDPLLPSGYDGMDGTYTLELRRTSDLGLLWSRVLGSPPTALAASADGQRVAVGTFASTRVLDAGSAALQFEGPGASFALAFSPTDELAISLGERVDVLDTSGALVRSVAIRGDAPTVIHAMMSDGECQEIFDTTGARAEQLAFARDGTLVASVSDGSVRALAGDDALRWLRPTDRDWGYRTTAVGFVQVSSTALRAIYGDALAVTLRTRTMASTGTRASACSAAETAIARRRLGAAVEGEPPNCAYVRSIDVDATGRQLSVGPITRVHEARGGGTLLTAPTLHTEAGLLVGQQAWLFGIDGTAERWGLGAGGGTFRGALPIPGRTGAVLDVSEGGRWVAIGQMRVEPHGSETYDGYDVHVVDTRSEVVLPFGVHGARARFLPGGARIALESFEHGVRAVEIRELPSGARVRRVELAAAEYGGLVAVDATHLVVAEGPHVRVIAIADGSEQAIDLPPCAIEAASLVGDRLAMRVYDQTTTEIGHHRIEVLGLDGALRSLQRASGASGHDVVLVESGAAAVYAGADGVAHRLDVASGAITNVAGIPAGVVGLTRSGTSWLYASRATGGAHVFTGTAQAATTLLDWTRGADHAGAAIAYELGGAAYVIGHDGRTRGALFAIDGGLVVRASNGAFSVTPDARAALSVRDGDALRPCDASMEPAHVPGLLEALLAP